MISSLTVTIPLALAIEIREALMRAKEDRDTLARIRSVAGSIEYVGKQPQDDLTLLQLREAMGEAQHDPPRRDTAKMKAVR